MGAAQVPGKQTQLEEIGEVLDNRKLSAKAKLKRIEEIVSGDPEVPDDDEGDGDL